LFVAALYGTRFVPEQFFPSSDRSELLVDLKLQDNASVLATRELADQFDKILAVDPDVVRFSTYVRQGAIRFYLPLDVALPNDFFAQSVVVTKGLKERDQVRARLEQAVAVQLPAAVVRVYPLELGPPVGWPVKYRVSGPDLARVHAIALQVAEQLEKVSGIGHINFDWAEPARVMRVHIDQDQARQLGLSSQDVSLALNGVVSGTTITQVRNSIYLINVDMRAEHKQRTSLESIRSLQIPLRDGSVVPLRQIASFEYSQEYPIVWRRDRVPTMTVQADVAPGLLPATAVQSVQPSIDRLAASLPIRLPHRDRWIRRGERQGAGVREGSFAGNGGTGLDHPDVSAAEFPACVAGAERGTARAHRGGCGTAGRAGAARFRRDTWRTGARRYDRPQFGYPHRRGRQAD
jgi:multidrug efflux pump subunit AcrB